MPTEEERQEILHILINEHFFFPLMVETVYCFTTMTFLRYDGFATMTLLRHGHIAKVDLLRRDHFEI